MIACCLNVDIDKLNLSSSEYYKLVINNISSSSFEQVMFSNLLRMSDLKLFFLNVLVLLHPLI
jgi:hypothetical protein